MGSALIRVRPLVFLAVLGIGLLVSGCQARGEGAGLPEARRLSKSNLTFSESAAFRYSNRFWPRSEPGSASSGGAQAVGCTSCR